MITINFDIPKEIVVVQERKVLIDTLLILMVVDNVSDKQVIVRVSINTTEIKDITIWSGDDYDNLGQWTDDDVVARIKEIYN